MKSENLGRFDGVQCLRFFAALLVVVTHSTFYVGERLVPGFSVWERGGLGVDVFFAISGFVMYVSSIGLEKEERGWIEFALKRLVRIVPMYWVATSIKLFVLIFASSSVFHSSLDAVYIIKSYLFIPARNVDGNIEPLLGVGWTLLFEMFFYFVFSVLLFLKMPVLRCVIVIFSAMSIISIIKSPSWPAISIYFDVRLLEFVAGMCIGKMVQNRKLPLWLALVSFVAGIYGIFWGFDFGFKFWNVDAAARMVTFVFPASLLVLGVAAMEPYFRGRFPSWIIYLGGASYSLYLFHPLISPAVPVILSKINFPNVWVSIVGSTMLAVIVSLFFYRFLEYPIGKILSELVRKLIRNDSNERVAISPTIK